MGAHKLFCYGLAEIAKVHRPVKAEQLKKIFPGTDLEVLQGPRHIDLLISHCEGELTPQREKVVGSLEAVNMAFSQIYNPPSAFDESYGSEV